MLEHVRRGQQCTRPLEDVLGAIEGDGEARLIPISAGVAAGHVLPRDPVGGREIILRAFLASAL